MQVRIIGNVKHDGTLLEEYEVYDLDPQVAQELIAAGNAKIPKQEVPKAKVSTYEPQKVDTDPKTGMSKPGSTAPDKTENPNPSAKIAKEEENKNSVKGVEQPNTNNVKGSEDGQGEK